MSEPAFDTLAASQKLQNSSFERQQAEGVIGAIADAQQNLVTKDDLKQVEDRLTGEIKVVSGEIKALNNKVDDKVEGLKGNIGNLRTITLGIVVPIMLTNMAMTAAMLVAMFVDQP